MKTAFIDFHDSFSYNVIQELKQLGFEVQVFEYPDYQKAFEFELVVLGPGPGHPDEYEDILPFIQKRIKEAGKLFGVCLGHQLIWRSFGFEVIKSKLPLHGQKIQINLNSHWSQILNSQKMIEVQRYNSLVADIKESQIPQGIAAQFDQEELQMSHGKNWLSYQFHPESVGTSYRSSFFSPLKKFPL